MFLTGVLSVPQLLLPLLTSLKLVAGIRISKYFRYNEVDEVNIKYILCCVFNSVYVEKNNEYITCLPAQRPNLFVIRVVVGA